MGRIAGDAKQLKAVRAGTLQDESQMVSGLNALESATEDFKKACSDYRVSQLEAIIKELRSALLANTKGVAVACDFLEKYAAWLEKRT